MANIVDYIHWRGDIPLYQVPLGEVDALILSYLAYMPFDEWVSSSFDAGETTLAQIAREMLEKNETEGLVLAFNPKEDRRLLQAIEKSERFGTMRLCGFVHRFDPEREEQFCAMTFLPPDGPGVVAYRGTDRTVVGWKEDFNMSFSGVVPAQRSAIFYAREAVEKLDMPLVFCGHSKGGNLAAFASMFAGEKTQEQIVCVYNFDGPGFNEEVIASEAFGRVNMRIHVFVPQSSMVGILLWHSEPFSVVKSESVSVLQHMPYHWHVMGGRLVAADGLSGDARLADITLKRWLRGLSPELRKQVIDGIYGVLSVSDGHGLADLFEPRNVLAIIRAAGAIDEETRAALIEAFRLLGNTLKETVPAFLSAAKGEEKETGMTELE